MKGVLALVLQLIIIRTCTTSTKEPILFGPTAGDSELTGDDVTTAALRSSITLPVGDGTVEGFSEVFIGTNGIIGLGERFNGLVPRDISSPITIGRRILCPYWVDLMTEGKDSAVFYKVYKREDSNDAAILQRVDEIIENSFNEFLTFKSTIVYKATWYNMTFFKDRTQRVTFQTLLVSDGQDTFSVVNYINVNARSTPGRRISIGYRYYTHFVESNAYSNQAAAFHMSEIPGNSRFDGFWVTRLTKATIRNPLENECYNWYAEQSSRPLPNVWWTACPCNGQNLRFFGFMFSYNRYDAANGVYCYTSLSFGSSLECCYPLQRQWWSGFRLGPLTRRIPAAGSVISANPFVQPIEYYRDNSRPKEACCASGHCDWYYSLRPRPSVCLRLIPVRTAKIWGDPHINTLDGGQYTFNGYGEYMVMKIDFNGTSFDLQARTELVTKENGTTINATIFSAFVAKDHTSSILQVELSRNKDKMYVHGDELDLTREFEDNPEFVRRTENMVLSKDNGTIVASFIKSAITVKISLGVRFLVLETMVHEKYRGKVTGLMGNFDGNSTNDFILPNGTTLYGENVSRERNIYYNFGQLWSVNNTTSLFHYDIGLSHDDYAHPDFKPIYIDEFPEGKVNKSKHVCGGDSATQACVFDYLATEDRSLAQSSGAEADASTADTASLENSIPEITGDSLANVKVNKSVQIAFNASDDGTFTYEILQEPLGFNFNNKTGIATWTPQNKNVANISVTVVDDKGEQAAPVDVAIVLCSGCNNNGICNYNNTRRSGSDMFSYAECDCNVGYSGQNCENDIDGCDQISCVVGTNCTDLSPVEEELLGRGYNCSGCPTGFYKIEDKYEDIDECNRTTTNTCNVNTEDCENTEGSYRCNCKLGYRKAGATCQDIDECTESTSGCEQRCENTPGSFNCSCVAGFTLNKDHKSCNSTGVDYCVGLNCEYTCDDADSGSAKVCICPTGYTMQNAENCIDIDECKIGGMCSQSCQNSVGSYTCSCYAGYSLNADKTTCSECEAPNYGVDCKQTCRCGKGMERCDRVKGCICKTGWTGSDCGQDVNECTDDPYICGDVKICKNLEGSYTCNCRAGYTKVNNDCVDINECDSVASNNCSSKTTTCANNNGSYSCTCKSGYKQLGKTSFECTDIDECKVGADGCSQTCLNKEGGFNCECEYGYTLGDDRKTCIEVRDICSLYPDLNCEYGCKQGSTNKSIGYCFCRSGYQLQAQDKRTCVDINECNNDTLNKCTFKDRCVNIEGSYNCSCPEGYSLLNDGRTCEECDGFNYGVDCKTPCDCGAGVDRCDNVRGCICLIGWAGPKCESDLNECRTGNLCTGSNQECKNTPGSYECRCAPGYSETSSGICEDINECNGTNPCSQLCTNTPGSHFCSCNAGFILVGTSQCDDYDECSAPVSPCDQVCSNTVGSYKCSCNPGFLLNTTTRVTCYAKTDCSNTTFNCSQKCGVNIDGSEYCFCVSGYKLHENYGTTCDDINECSPNPCAETCTEANPGSGYICSCAVGRKLGVDQRTCVVCESRKFGLNCANNCICDVQNTDSCDPVSGKCTCRTGWNGSTCSEDINECLNSTLCPNNSNCSNTNGSYLCICYPGYSLIGGQCVECSSTTYGEHCSQRCTCDITNTQTCNKQTGSCDCQPGWTNKNCTEDIDECTLNSTICGSNARCINTPGSYDCKCDTGFQKISNGLCEDINECIVGPVNCDTNAVCINVVGSVRCLCLSGFMGNGSTCIGAKSSISRMKDIIGKRLSMEREPFEYSAYA